MEGDKMIMVDTLTSDQSRGYEILRSGRNAFLTGDAGTGKTYLLEKFIQESKDLGKGVIITAFTGIAALNIGGTTLHRLLRCNVGPLAFYKVSKVPDALVDADILIVDEISMVRRDLFEYLVKTLKLANAKREANNKPNIQFIVVGDFFQLPPVINKTRDFPELSKAYGNDLREGFAFQSEYWDYCNFNRVHLKEIVRQTDKTQSEYLSMLRNGDINCIDYLNEISSQEVIPEAITLCATNDKALEINNLELTKINNPIKMYHSKITGEVAESDKVTIDHIPLKVGARVMTVVNDPDGMYVNGSLGNVIKLLDNEVFVKLDNGKAVRIKRYEWKILNYKSKNGKPSENVVGRYEQIPLKLAWAVTIHKSQGQTYDAINIADMERIWGKGQLYVAMSRVRDLEKVHLNSPITRNNVKSSLSVKSFYDMI